jgi:carbon-monoxide dehydrogenase medium subunit
LQVLKDHRLVFLLCLIKGSQAANLLFSLIKFIRGGANVTTQVYFRPRSLAEALGLLNEHSPAMMVMAGGTLAMPLINKGVSRPDKVMGLRQAGLDYVHPVDGGVRIGAAAPLSRVRADSRIPLLAEAVKNVAGWAVQNVGTAGGNLFAPPPAGDLAVALLALDAQVKVASHKRGERLVPLAKFFTGFLTNCLAPDELLVEIQVPKPNGRSVLLKYGRLNTNTPAIVSVAVSLVTENGRVRSARVALNAVGPHPFRALQAEAALIDSLLNAATIKAASSAAAAECEPFTDPIASADYRRKMTGVFVQRALTQVAA